MGPSGRTCPPDRLLFDRVAESHLAAVGMAVAAGIASETIRNALATFQTSYEQSPGRLNFHHGHPFTVMMDYAHNPAGLTHLKNLITGLKKNHNRVIGVLSASGDRRAAWQEKCSMN